MDVLIQNMFKIPILREKYNSEIERGVFYLNTFVEMGLHLNFLLETAFTTDESDQAQNVYGTEKTCA